MLVIFKEKKRLSETVETLEKEKERWLKYYLSMVHKKYPDKSFTWIANKTAEIARGEAPDDFHPWTAIYSKLRRKKLGGMGSENVKGFVGELKALALSNIRLLRKLAAEKDKEEREE